MQKKHIFIGIFLTGLMLVIHLLLMPDYGLTWDFHHIFFQGLRAIGRPITPDLTDHIPFGKPAPWDMFDVPFGQLMPIMSAWGYRFFHEITGWLPLDSAFHLSTVVIGSVGLFFLYGLLYQAYGFAVAITGFTILALYPRYFSEIQNNIKDVPQVAFFGLSMWLIYRFLNRRSALNLILAAAAFAVAFNIKINSVFIPAVAGAWILVLLISRSGANLAHPLRIKPIKNLLPLALYFPLAGILALVIWITFWDQPFKELLYIPRYFQENTKNMESLLGGRWYCSTVNVPWYYPFYYLGIVTPLPVLFSFLAGLIVVFRDAVRKKPVASLLLLWFFLPLARFIDPKVAVMDGIRHFEEVIYPLCAISAVGAVRIYIYYRQLLTLTAVRQFINGKQVILEWLLPAGLLIYLIYNIVAYHPFQIAYYNELVGGIRGAYTRYDLDYWGSSQKKAAEWLNTNAPLNSNIYIVMVPDVAAKYLRPDLLSRLNTRDRDVSDFVVVLNRQSFFYRYFYTVEYMLLHEPVYAVKNQGVPLVWIFDNKNPRRTFKPKWWTGESPCIRKYWTSVPP